MPTKLYWLHTLSPTHVGIGRGLGYIDLPIDRDGVTNWPIIRASGFKGVWADHFKATEENRKNDPILKAAFGLSSSKENESNSGALIPTDAKLVCLPVRSFKGTFAWVTSPLCLQMLRRTLTLAGMKNLPSIGEIAKSKAHISPEDPSIVENNSVYLEDLDLPATPCNEANNWAKKIADWVFTDEAWKTQFIRRFVVIPNDLFDFLCETGTEVHTRIKINDDTKIVQDGALWTEESLPAETILMGIVQCERVFQQKESKVKPEELLKTFATDTLTLQMGGKATVGRGQVRCIFSEVK